MQKLIIKNDFCMCLFNLLNGLIVNLALCALCFALMRIEQFNLFHILSLRKSATEWYVSHLRVYPAGFLKCGCGISSAYSEICTWENMKIIKKIFKGEVSLDKALCVPGIHTAGTHGKMMKCSCVSSQPGQELEPDNTEPGGPLPLLPA